MKRPDDVQDSGWVVVQTIRYGMGKRNKSSSAILALGKHEHVPHQTRSREGSIQGTCHSKKDTRA